MPPTAPGRPSARSPKRSAAERPLACSGSCPTRSDAVGAQLLQTLTDSGLYSIGAYFCDSHPELVDDVLQQSLDIERLGLAAWALDEDVPVESAVQTLITGLAIRYFTAVAGNTG